MQFIKNFLISHVRLAIRTVVVLVCGIAAWYVLSNVPPTLGLYPVTRGNITAAIDEPGTLAAESKADLSFQEAGRIAHVYVKEGDVVSTGEALAALNSASFEANASQASAALAAAKAKLDGLETGATLQTIAVSQASLVSAEQSLTNGYAGVPNVLNDAYAKANDAVRTQLASFFSSPESNSPQLTFQISDLQTINNIESARLSVTNELNAWQNELTNVTANPTQNLLDAALQNAASHLSVIQNLMNLALTAVTDQIGLQGTSTFKPLVTTGLTEVNAAVAEVSGSGQTIASEKAAVSQAQAQLNLTTASSTPQIIQEQKDAVAQAAAAYDAAQVALSETSLTAPFPGTVQSLIAQVGQVVSPGSPTLSLVNNGGVKIETYISQADVAKVKAGGAARVTLDAFGTEMEFPATVTTVDSAETLVNGAPLYLTTLHFINPEPQVKDGMTGNVHIVLSEDDNVVAIPSRLILNSGSQYFVLLKTPAGIEQRKITVGSAGDNGMTEITSGINEGDTLANF